MVVSPDAGRAKLAEKFAGELGVRPAFLTKHRPEHNVAEAGYVVGDVAGKAAILVDDMIDTAGTLIEAARVVRESGATRVYAAATHGIFSGPAFERLAGPEIEEIVVTDTVPLAPEAPDKIKTLSVADILARSIRSIFTDGSVSELFAGDNQLVLVVRGRKADGAGGSRVSRLGIAKPGSAGLAARASATASRRPELVLAPAELRRGLVAEPPLARDPVPVPRARAAGPGRPARRPPCAAP